MKKGLGNNYQWLKLKWMDGEYVPPDYYDEILPLYDFDGAPDWACMERFIADQSPHASHCLELGPGTGRGTQVVARYAKRITAVELSSAMCNALRQRFAGQRVEVVNEEMITFMRNLPAEPVYDLVVSLWALPHGVHHPILKEGFERGAAIAREGLDRLLAATTPGGKMGLLHFDARSDEQMLVMPMWEKVFAWAEVRAGDMSPSERVMRQWCADHEGAGTITYKFERHAGDPITFPSVESALEVMMNLHMEMYFNQHPLHETVIRELGAGLQSRAVSDGSVTVKPAAYFIEVTKNV